MARASLMFKMMSKMKLVCLMTLTVLLEEAIADLGGIQVTEAAPLVYKWSLGDSGTADARNAGSCISTWTLSEGEILFNADGIINVVQQTLAPEVVEESCAVWLNVSDDWWFSRFAFISLGNFNGTCVSDLRACKSGGYTWAVWLKISKTDPRNKGRHSNMICSASGDHESAFNLWITDERHVLCSVRTYHGRRSVRINTTALVTPGSWFHVACVFDFSKWKYFNFSGEAYKDVAKAYLNGVESQPLQEKNDDYYQSFEDAYYCNNLSLGRFHRHGNDLGYSNLVVADATLASEDVYRLYSCGSTEWNLKIRSLARVPGTQSTHIQLLCTSSAATGSFIDWRVYQPKCSVWINLYDGLHAGAVRIDNRNVSSCVHTSGLTIFNYYERGYDGSVIVCSASTQRNSSTVSANFTIPDELELSQTSASPFRVGNKASPPPPLFFRGTESSLRPTSTDGRATPFLFPFGEIRPVSLPLFSAETTTSPLIPVDGIASYSPSPSLESHTSSLPPPSEPTEAPDDVIYPVNPFRDICGGRRTYEKEDKVIIIATLSAAKGEYDEVSAALDGLVYKANIPGIPSNETISLVMTIYKAPGNAVDITLNGKSNNPTRYGSRVLGLDVITESGMAITDFHKAPIRITFPVEEITEFEIPICSFYANYKTNWRTDGCSVGNFIGDDVTCSCDHLTHFAVLLQLREVEENKTLVLDILTRIGLGLSIACLAVTLLVYAICRLTSTRIVTHANLAFSLMMSHLTFLFVDIQNPVACTAVAILLHLFLLAAFTWMALEGVFLYIQTTPTFRWKIRLPIWFLIGWGCPAVVVAVSVAARFYGYVRGDSCWLSFDSGLVWAFLAPAICILVGNTLMLIWLIHIFFSLKSNKDKSEAAKMKAGLRVVVVLEPLLGLPWILNLLYVSPSTIFFAYASVILNSLQGVFVFLFQCVFDEEVRKTFRAKTTKVEAISIIPESTGVSTAGN